MHRTTHPSPAAGRRTGVLAPLALLVPLALLAVGGGLLPAAAAAREQPQPDYGLYRPIVARAAPMVTVKFVVRIKIEGAGTDRELDGEIDCLMVDPSGLVLCSNTELGGYISLMGRMMASGRGNLNLSGAPSDIKVLVGDDTEGRDGRLMTRDTDRDLAWVQIDAVADDERFVHLDLASSAALAIGDRFFALRLMDKFFSRLPVVAEGTVGAITAQPRRLYVPAEPLGVGFGQPVFTADGTLVGITVMQTPSLDEAQNLFANPLAFLSSSTKVSDMVGGLVLPAAEVLKATRVAQEIIAEDQAELAAVGEG